MIKFLHCGDYHLSSPFSSIKNSQKASVRRSELLKTFFATIDLAVASGVNIFLVAGDLFENEFMSVKTLNAILAKMGEWGGISFFLTTGNHDYLSKNSPYNFAQIPQNVHLFRGREEKVYLENLNINVYGASFTSRYEENSFLEGFVAEDGIPSIFVCHGNIMENSPYNKISKESIANSGLTYLALGHIHSFLGVMKEGGTSYAYCGCPMGRGFDEMEQKGVIIGEIEGDKLTKVEFTPIKNREYRTLEIPLKSEMIIEEIAEAIEIAARNSGEQNLYKVKLTGEYDDEIDLIALENLCGDSAFYLEIENKCKKTIDYEKIAGENTLKGLFTKEILAKIASATEDEREVLELALTIGYEKMEV